MATPPDKPETGGQTAAKVRADDEPKFYVNGEAVEKKVYLTAAPAAGWNPEFLEENNFYPSISTKKHGEK